VLSGEAKIQILVFGLTRPSFKGEYIKYFVNKNDSFSDYTYRFTPTTLTGSLWLHF